MWKKLTKKTAQKKQKKKNLVSEIYTWECLHDDVYTVSHFIRKWVCNTTNHFRFFFLNFFFLVCFVFVRTASYNKSLHKKLLRWKFDYIRTDTQPHKKARGPHKSACRTSYFKNYLFIAWSPLELRRRRRKKQQQQQNTSKPTHNKIKSSIKKCYDARVFVNRLKCLVL